jgi:hypothetical protein
MLIGSHQRLSKIQNDPVIKFVEAKIRRVKAIKIVRHNYSRPVIVEKLNRVDFRQGVERHRYFTQNKRLGSENNID